MSHPPLAATAEPAGPPPCLAAAPPRTGKRRGNPDLGLAPRCGARTRAGCPCRAPAIRGRLRCRMHGGRSTGPRTSEGMARLRAARTVHGAYSAETRARNRYDLTALRRGQVGNAAARCVDRLPPDLASRLLRLPPELMPPPPPSGGLTPAQDRAVLRAEAAALAPWRAAIAQAGLAGWAGEARPAVVADRPGASAEAHAPVALHGDPAAARGAAGGAHPDGAAKAHAPESAGGAGSTAQAAPPAAPAAAQAEAHAPERAVGGRGDVPAAAPAAHGDPMHRRQKPMHQTARPTRAAPSRPRRPRGMAPRCNSRQKPMHQNAARRRPTPSRRPCPTARRAGAARACNGACTGPLPRAPAYDIGRYGRIGAAGPPAAAPRRRAGARAQPSLSRDRQGTVVAGPPAAIGGTKGRPGTPFRSPDRPDRR